MLYRIMRRRVAKIVLDTMLFVGFIIEFLTREPDFDADYLLHSWTGIVLIPVIIFHLSGNWGWVQRVWDNKQNDREFGLGLLNATLGAMAWICIISGFPLWLDWSIAGWLSSLHQITGLVAILLMFVHLFWNRRRIGSLLRRVRAAS
jgi:predicted ferric reductase